MHPKTFHNCFVLNTAWTREIVTRGEYPLGLIEYMIERVYQVFCILNHLNLSFFGKVRGGYPQKTFGLMKSQRWVPPKNLGWWKVRGGHPFGLMQIPRNAKFKWFKMQKTWYTLSIIYSINPRGYLPLVTISLFQAVH